LDVTALQSALNQIVARHEVLRTTIVSVDGTPVQIIGAAREVVLPIIDLRTWPEASRETEAHRILVDNIRRPFDLSRDLMLRAMLVRLTDDEYFFLLVKHHIASDGWSSGILWRELSTLYRAFALQEPAYLPELSVQYQDYATWQREWLQGEVVEKQLLYWKKQLAGLGKLLLPTDRPRPPRQTFNGARQFSKVSPELAEQIRALSRSHGVTLFMTLLAAFQTLLHRQTDQGHIAIGTPIAGRSRIELENLIGFFVNTLVLRTDFSDNPTFTELLRRVREVALGAYAHQDIPFEKLVEELQTGRDLSSAPLFQVSFALQNVPQVAVELSGLEATAINIRGGIAKFDLYVAVVDVRSELQIFAEYNTDLFDSTTIDRLLGEYERLLRSIVGNPDRRISDLAILTEAEQHQLVVEWNDTQRDSAPFKCAHQMFEEQVERTPDGIAVVFEEQELTYRELNSRANQVAHFLKKLGVGGERLVGIYMGRSLEMIVGLLAVLKAGGAYLPLDPEIPKERLSFMLAESQTPLLLTQQRYLAELPDTNAQVICLDTQWQDVMEEGHENLLNTAAPENLAYVIYTSGSTGKPKGVMIEHRGLTNYLSWCLHAYPVSQGHGSPVHSSLSFDLTVTVLYAPLLTGRTVYLLPQESPVESLSEAFKNRRHYSLVKITPAHLQLLGQQLREEEASGRTHAFIIGGEALLPEHIEFWKEHSPQTKLINEYGPTETVVGCCVYEVGDRDRNSTSIPIGRPITNTQLYILDQHWMLVPIGVPGELYIGGEGLARGYLEQPALTAEKFVPHPFTREPGARLYKTGDQARYLPDGNIEFLGRIDHQVKIRGFRIELGEIESVLGEHGSVRESVVTVREDPVGEKSLVAYVVPMRAGLAIGELRSFLRAKLPEYMIPSTFVFLEKLPLTTNGKVDRKNLPMPDLSERSPEGSYLAPRTAVEEVVADIWAEALNVSRIGVQDNFFELGGHSLKATRVNSRLCTIFKMELPLRMLFEHPTVESLARAVLARETRPGQVEKIANLHQQLKNMSADQVRMMLRTKKQERAGK
jgi:amino acid adenylation domain-containing protein